MLTHWDYPDPFTTEVRVEQADIDGLGHTNNASYIIWCEACAWRHSESLGLSVEDYQRLDRGVAIQHAEYDYAMPSFAGERLTVGTWLVHCDGRLRLTRRFQIINPAKGQTVLRGHWNLVGVVLSTGRATRLPRQFISTYSAAIVSSRSG